MYINLTTDMSLDKRIAEIEKEVKNNKYAYEYYIDEYTSLMEAKNKKERNDNNNY